MTDLELRALSSSSVQSAGDRCRLAIGKCTAAPVSVRGKPDYRKRRALDAVREAPMVGWLYAACAVDTLLVFWLVYAVVRLQLVADALAEQLDELSLDVEARMRIMLPPSALPTRQSS